MEANSELGALAKQIDRGEGFLGSQLHDVAARERVPVHTVIRHALAYYLAIEQDGGVAARPEQPGPSRRHGERRRVRGITEEQVSVAWRWLTRPRERRA